MSAKSSTPEKLAEREKTRALSKVEYLQLEVYGVLLTLFAIALFLALVTFNKSDVGVGVGGSTHNLLGPVGAHMADLFLWLLGLCTFLLDIGLGFLAIDLRTDLDYCRYRF